MAQEKQNHRWIEVAAKLPTGGMVRNRFVCRDNDRGMHAWRRAHRNTDVYATIARFAEPDRGSAYTCDFFLDIDSQDLHAARAAALKACDLLAEHLGIDRDACGIFFSGAKGFHVIVSRAIFGNPVGPQVIAVWRMLAGNLVKAGVPHIDMGIYQAARLLRLPNSIHSKTGLHKVALEYQELRDWGMRDILDLARRPREEESMAVPSESDKAAAWFRSAAVRANRTYAIRGQVGAPTGAGWRMPPCIRAIEGATLPDGIRHEAYFQFARFLASTNAAPEEILRRLQEIDDRNSIHDDAHLWSLASRAVKYRGFRTCPLLQLERFCDHGQCPLAVADGQSGSVGGKSKRGGVQGAGEARALPGKGNQSGQ